MEEQLSRLGWNRYDPLTFTLSNRTHSRAVRSFESGVVTSIKKPLQSQIHYFHRQESPSESHDETQARFSAEVAKHLGDGGAHSFQIRFGKAGDHQLAAVIVNP